jgi:membrane protease YdiL (CAAX protease family)
MAVVIGISFCCGARVVDPKFHLGPVTAPLIGIALQAALVGLIEEVLFRGFVLQSFLRDMRTWLAVVVTSVAFAALHFLDVKVILPVGFDPLAGFRGLAILKGLVGGPAATMLPELAGLALVGVVLSCAYVWTGSLYLCIGLHAGWVFSLKSARLLFQRNPAVVPWFFGDGLVVTGVLGILSLVTVLGILYWVWGRRGGPRRQGRDA